MLLKNKFSYLKYIFGTLLNIGFVAAFYWGNLLVIKTSIVVILTSIVNHVFLLKSISMLLSQTSGKAEKQNFKILIYFILKTITLGLGMFIAMKYIPQHMHMAIILYIFQLIILALSIKRYVVKN